jgi:hypothetical protein
MRNVKNGCHVRYVYEAEGHVQTYQLTYTQQSK